jgi:hypothetical protein
VNIFRRTNALPRAYLSSKKSPIPYMYSHKDRFHFPFLKKTILSSQADVISKLSFLIKVHLNRLNT